VLLRLLTAAFGTRPTSRHVRVHGESCPNNANAQTVAREVAPTASAMAIAIDLVQASDRSGIDAAFATLVRQ
jgi:hypothetical protein